MRLEPPSWWYGGRIPAAAWGLAPISAIYGALVERRFKKAQPYRGKLPVICVGNFTMGGAGKTPVALKLASMLQAQGHKPAFLTRGYGGKERGPHLVNPDLDVAAQVGDEPLLLAEAAPTVVCRNRPLGARFLETLDADVIIMDDGFQNPSLTKDFSLIVIDAHAGVGSGHVFPLGPLRARLEFQARMADAILVVGGKTDGIMNQISQGLARCRNAFEAKIAPLIPGEMRERPFLAFCGIGRPTKFFETLREAGVSIAKTRAFPDHHSFAEEDAKSLLAEAMALKAGLITTGKDMARLKGAYSGALADLHRLAFALPITIEFSGNDELNLLSAVEQALADAANGPSLSAQGGA